MNIQRDIIQRLIAWKESSHRQPLILQGARQIGKTWTVTEFGKQYYKNVAVFNFDKQPELSDVFSQTKDVRRILRELSFYTGVPIVPHDTLLFLMRYKNVPQL